MSQAVNPFTFPIDILGVWRIGLFVGTFTCMLLLMRWYRRELGWEGIALWSWAISSCLYIVEFPLVPYGQLNVIFQAAAGQTLAELMLVPAAILAAPKVIWRVVTAYMWVSIVVIWSGHSLLTPWQFPSPSFDTALLALYLPFAGRSLQIVSVVTILGTHGSAALTVILAEVLAIGLTDRRFRVALLFLAPAAVGFAYLHSDSAWFDSWTRFRYWKDHLHFWAYGPATAGPPAPHWWQEILWTWVFLGMGPGSFIWFYGITHNWEDAPPALHMELFQITTELGVIGAALVLVFFFRLLWKSWRDARVRAGLFGIFAFSLTWYPLRSFAPAFLVGLILREAIKIAPTSFKIGAIAERTTKTRLLRNYW